MHAYTYYVEHSRWPRGASGGNGSSGATDGLAAPPPLHGMPPARSQVQAHNAPEDHPQLLPVLRRLRACVRPRIGAPPSPPLHRVLRWWSTAGRTPRRSSAAAGDHRQLFSCRRLQLYAARSDRGGGWRSIRRLRLLIRHAAAAARAFCVRRRAAIVCCCGANESSGNERSKRRRLCRFTAEQRRRRSQLTLA